jgi:4-hydroxyphenylacetate 3-monooxygenase/anthranilate 3-monooxygenase (FAD)/4-hydroxyphenylacetate 3-monooxygenase
MGARCGEEYVEGLKDDREVWLGAEQVDVATSPVLAGSVAGVAGWFDWQHEHADECIVADPETGEGIGAGHLVPRGPDDLRRRAVAFERLARYSMGVLGRTPDYLAATLAGFAGRPDVFGANGDARAVEAVQRFHREAASGDLAMTHTIVHPTVDKAVGDVEGVNGELALRIVRRTDDGVVVRGARVVATLGPFADEMFVYPGQPLPETSDPAYALAFSVPLATAGLVTVCRDHYGTPGGVAVADRPFSSRFDEQDAFVVFDDVEVPWERVFIDGDIDIYNRIMRSGWTGNIMQQTSIRAAVKLEFAYELASRMAEATNAAGRPETAQQLGEIWGYSALVRAAVTAAEAGASEYGAGTWFCDERPLRALRASVPGWMVRTNEILCQLGGHNLLATPEAAAFAVDGLGDTLRRYLPGADGMAAADRSRLFRTAWDFAGSALGGRGELYERFYLASAGRNLGINHVLAQREQAWAEVPAFLDRSPS